jgi:hypothetical protein
MQALALHYASPGTTLSCPLEATQLLGFHRVQTSDWWGCRAPSRDCPNDSAAVTNGLSSFLNCFIPRTDGSNDAACTCVLTVWGAPNPNPVGAGGAESDVFESGDCFE